MDKVIQVQMSYLEVNLVQLVRVQVQVQPPAQAQLKARVQRKVVL